MLTRDIATIQFTDQDSGDEAVAVVRAVDGSIALCVSLAHGGDVEVVLSPGECQRLVDALRQAMAPTTVIN